MRAEPWMDKDPMDAFAERAKEGHWQRDGHLIQRCDATTGHFVRTIAMCETDEVAEFIISCIHAALT